MVKGGDSSEVAADEVDDARPSTSDGGGMGLFWSWGRSKLEMGRSPVDRGASNKPHELAGRWSAQALGVGSRRAEGQKGGAVGARARELRRPASHEVIRTRVEEGETAVAGGGRARRQVLDVRFAGGGGVRRRMSSAGRALSGESAVEREKVSCRARAAFDRTGVARVTRRRLSREADE